MWTGKVISTERHGSTLTILVVYSNGEEGFPEQLYVTEAQTEKWLEEKIGSRIRQLNLLDGYSQTISSSEAVGSVFQVDANQEVNKVIEK